ncbi:MAG: T9SS type A sorting domain-containing protein [Saprospiraceae bacterium]|nr:T9SS type A sorting domain-containing protein [Saprospiraceae bacterium]
MRLQYLLGFFFILPLLTVAQKPEPGFTLKPLLNNPVVERQYQQQLENTFQQIEMLTGQRPSADEAAKAGCPMLESGVEYVVAGDSTLVSLSSPFFDTFLIASPPSPFGTAGISGENFRFIANQGIIAERDTVLVARCNTGANPFCDTLMIPLVIKRHNTSYVEPTQPWQPKTMGTYCATPITLPGTLNCGKIVACPDPYEGEGEQLVYFTTYSEPDFCVVYESSYFPGTDTVCLVYCDDFAVCDTVKVPFAIEGDTLNLPFLDDFAYEGPYPDPGRWLNQDVFINSSLAIDPISWGVATFDGLSKTGRPYGGNFGTADYLTSKQIDLTTTTPGNNVIFSFFAQPRGLGFVPISTDSLIVEFKDVDGNWVHVFSRPGVEGFIPLDSFPKFTYHALGISDPKFFHKGFQFRFKTLNDRSGAYSNWNLDYVWLAPRPDVSPSLNDIAFTTTPSGVLKRYTAMPLKQFRGFEDQEILNNYSVGLYNLDFSDQPIENDEFVVVNLETGTTLTSGERLLEPIQRNVPTMKNVYYENPVRNAGTLSSNISSDINGIVKAKIRTSYFLSRLNAEELPQYTNSNNTCYTDTDLSNYYAYDDGVAEGALELNGNGSMMLVRYESNVTDSLRGVMFHFPHVNGDVQNQIFNLLVHVGPLDTFSREITYTRTLLRPFYADNVYDTLQGFTTYGLYDPEQPDQPIALEIPAGEFYVGWQQGSNAANPIPVGFDKNNPGAINQIYQNTGIRWENLSKFTFIRGALMVRPIFGDSRPLPTGTDDISGLSSDIEIFPNPTLGQLNLKIPYGMWEDYQVQVFNAVGVLQRSMVLENGQIDISQLEKGMYFIKVVNTESRELWTKKVMKF